MVNRNKKAAKPESFTAARAESLLIEAIKADRDLGHRIARETPFSDKKMAQTKLERRSDLT